MDENSIKEDKSGIDLELNEFRKIEFRFGSFRFYYEELFILIDLILCCVRV